MDDFAVVTAYFNPLGLKTRAENFVRFASGMLDAGVPLIVVYGSFDDPRCRLPPTPGALVIRVPLTDVIWQKERLMNVGFDAAPRRYEKLAWIDGDVLFENPEWASNAAAALDRAAIVQLFEEVVRLPRGESSYAGSGEVRRGFAARFNADGNDLATLAPGRHGHPGYAWAARREILAGGGLYDCCIVGGGDHAFAHAALGNLNSPCLDKVVGWGPHRAHYARWADQIGRRVNGAIGAVPGRLLHLWHGDTANRRYAERNQELHALGFDPATDVRVAASGALEWTGARPQLERWAYEYFVARDEDGGGVRTADEAA